MSIGGGDSHRKPASIKEESPGHPAARDPQIQDRLLRYCAPLTGVTL
jgi:hypothetical protein